MTTRGRSVRRHNAGRVKARTKRMMANCWAWPSWEGLYYDDPKLLGKVARTPKMCRGMCCGNPRRHLKQKTQQEKAADHE